MDITLALLGFGLVGTFVIAVMSNRLTASVALILVPVVFAVGGVAFPLGVLIYWTTSNLWTMGQQFYVIRNNPAPGTPAFKAKQDRDAKHGKTVTEDPLEELEKPTPPPGAMPRGSTSSRRRGRSRPTISRSSST